MMIMRCLLINPVYSEPTQTICNKECTNVLQIRDLCNPIANLENMRFQEAKKILQDKLTDHNHLQDPWEFVGYKLESLNSQLRLTRMSQLGVFSIAEHGEISNT